MVSSHISWHQSPSMPSENIRKNWFSDVFQEVLKNTKAMKPVKYIFNKYLSRMLIFMLSSSRSALVLTMHSRGIKFLCFLI